MSFFPPFSFYPFLILIPVLPRCIESITGRRNRAWQMYIRTLPLPQHLPVSVPLLFYGPTYKLFEGEWEILKRRKLVMGERERRERGYIFLYNQRLVRNSLHNSNSYHRRRFIPVSINEYETLVVIRRCEKKFNRSVPFFDQSIN